MVYHSGATLISILGNLTRRVNVVLRESRASRPIPALADAATVDVPCKEGWTSSLGVEASMGSLNLCNQWGAESTMEYGATERKLERLVCATA